MKRDLRDLFRESGKLVGHIIILIGLIAVLVALIRLI